MAITEPQENSGFIVTEIEKTALDTTHINEDYLYLKTKRMIDVIGASIGLILLLPIFFLVFVFIKIEDGNQPVLFRQKRVGINGKQFYMYKFRSMVCNAEELKLQLLKQNEANGPVFKIKLDPRVTRVGKFIRKTSIDELPQLYNILKGEMSLVGPRPPLPEEVEHYSSYEWRRLGVVPGLTCYWQVGGRSDIRFEKWMELDLKYIKERNMWVDLKLIFKTVLLMFGCKGAY
ncbi:sugar transferase [Planococcus sp. CAU13]|uniref:sugar transferase n=1 Tax=Planococcus sp. CAU13 TaxID=1541197 RepID=UPI000B12EDD7|nr:sugar transferase [Planococcus sp. CAU13]